VIDAISVFKASVAGFAATDRLDFTSVAFGSTTKESYAAKGQGGILTVTDGTQVAKLTLLGQYAAAGFGIEADGHGGTNVTYTPPQPHALVLAASG
jgi:hypothetical protein